MTGVHLEGVVAGYRGRPVLGPVDTELAPGVHALLGRNGAGKTTLMRVMAGVLPPIAGRVLIGGTDLAADREAKRAIGVLAHRAALSPQLSVRDNLEFWARVRGLDGARRAVRIREAAERFDIEGLLDRRTARLSRGQLQRADLARLTLTDPQVLLLDEPLTGLDPVSAERTRELVRSWGADRTVLYSTHSVPEALTLASRMLVLGGGTLTALPVAQDPAGEAEPSAYDLRTSRRAGAWERAEVGPDTTIGAYIAGLVAAGVEITDVRPVSTGTPTTRPTLEASIHQLLDDPS
ncbi:ABC transporter ATP-binding protein [Streptomyces sp. LaPpAH-108]|uniref:ABC transporter ATP-binding protein n=1 Tax=Streptomyces sp. LaPpAH-108 TaxID=1155714 RepID=UPI000683F01F|nr:ABC transporter ATP-binding protein [Streptomyces sp. LaPpAH-108]